VTHRVDAEVAAVLATLPPSPPRPRGDWRALREAGNAGQAWMASLVPRVEGVSISSHSTVASDGAVLELRWYAREGVGPGSAVVYAHGGGMVLGTLDAYDSLLAWYVAATGVPFLSVGYRLAPEAQGTKLSEDVFAGLGWLIEHASSLGVDQDRIALMGDSGGGAPAAGAAILARDRGIPIAGQILIYPMLDDRNQIPDAALEPFATWSYDNNFTAWSAVLGAAPGAAGVSPIVAPARLADFAGLAPAYIEVGELDIFRDEDIAYAQSLARAGVSVELHVHPGAPHGFERFAPRSALAIRAMNDRWRVIAAM
jgi:acetyl esterase/lipase